MQVIDIAHVALHPVSGALIFLGQRSHGFAKRIMPIVFTGPIFMGSSRIIKFHDLRFFRDRLLRGLFFSGQAGRQIAMDLIQIIGFAHIGLHPVGRAIVLIGQSGDGRLKCFMLVGFAGPVFMLSPGIVEPDGAHLAAKALGHAASDGTQHLIEVE